VRPTLAQVMEILRAAHKAPRTHAFTLGPSITVHAEPFMPAGSAPVPVGVNAYAISADDYRTATESPNV